MIDLNNLKNIVFDLGGVLLNLDFDASIKAFQKLGLDNAISDKGLAYSDNVFYELETGKISPGKFRDRIRIILNNVTASDMEIDDAWCSMILDIPEEKVKVLQHLNNDFNIYLFSNTNQIHISRLHKWFELTYGFGFPSLFTKDIYSHEIHKRKPDRESFEKVIEITGINPLESLFIDDLEKNIKGAEEAGFRTFWFNNPQKLGDLFPGKF